MHKFVGAETGIKSPVNTILGANVGYAEDQK